MDAGALTARLGAALLTGRRVVLGLQPLAAVTRQVDMLRNHGADRPLVLARGLGTGPTPSPDDAEIVMLDLPAAATITDDLHLESQLLHDPPPAVVAAVDAYDPDRLACWWVAPHLDVVEVSGRPVIGPRRPEWVALEDKTVVDALFDACGVRRPASATTAATYEAATAAAAAVDAGAGTVWSGDARDGINGGGELVRWVRTEREARAAVELLARHCDRVRVAEFVDGVPCSIHGIVLPDGVAVLRPVELLMLRRPGGLFLYGGMASWWDPPGADRQVMRAAARRVGAELAQRVGFRGAFSVDGVLGSGGWVPTEVNTRYSGGMGMLSRAVPDFPLLLLQLAIVEGVDVGVSASQVETFLLRATDEHRTTAAHTLTSRAPAHGEVAVDTPDGSLVHGASTIGGLVRLTPAAGVLVAGDRVGPLAARALARADELWGTDFGPTALAPDVRTG